jgi:iron complex outermembrane receptor protein
MNGQYHGAMAGVTHWLQPERIVESEAFFAQATYGLTDRLFLTVGARNTKDAKEDRGGRNFGCGWGNQACHIDAWGQVPWGLVNWGAFGDLSQQSPEFFEAAVVSRNQLNSLPATHYDYPNANYGIDSFNDIREEWSKTTWRVGLDYDINDDTMIYGYVANGYKGGGVGDVLIKPSNGERFDTSYNAEEVVTYEFGIKTTLMDGRMNFRANAFISDYEEQQFTAWTIFDVIINDVFDNEGNPVQEREEIGTFLTRNAGKSKISGVELEMEFKPWEGGHIGGYLTHLKTEIDSDYWKRWGAEPAQVFKDYTDGPLDVTKPWFRNLKGNDLAWSPEWSLALNFSHEFKMDNGATLTPFLHISWQDEMYFDIDNRDKWDLDPSVLNEVHDLDIYTDKRDAYTMATASLNYRSADDIWFAEAYVYNLTDEDVNWWQSYANQTPLAAKSERSWGLRFGYQF